jgi:tetratricopeptide (TPR) repeat protein
VAARQFGHAEGVQPVATTHDLLQQAATAPEPERRVLIARAEALAHDAGEWQALADAWAKLADAAAAERCLVLALQQSNHDIWDYRRAAATRALLGDHRGAVATLARLEAAFHDAVDSSGLHWQLLAAGYAELQDLSGVHRCLDAGRERARTVDDVCAIAKAHAELVGDREATRRLLLRAETIAATAVDWRGGPDAAAWWTVANAWSELLRDEPRARAGYESGLAMAADVSGCLLFARFWVIDQEPCEQRHEVIQRSLDKARGLATTFAAWYEIAQVTRERDGSLGAVRSALARAEALVTTSAERRRLALARRDWLGEADHGAASAPVGLLPEELAPRRITALGWVQDAGALLEWLRPQMTEARISAIADADGGFDRDDHLVALRGIVDSGRIPVPLEWEPREVLSLSQWAEGLDVDHVQRAFCGTVLCLAKLGPDPRGYEGIESTLAILLESCAILGADALTRAEGMSVAMSESPECETRERAFAALGLLLAAAQRDPHDPRLEPLAAQLLAVDADLVHQDHYVHPEHGFVLGATYFDQRDALWKRLVQETFAEWQDGPARPALAEVVRRLRG